MMLQRTGCAACGAGPARGNRAVADIFVSYTSGDRDWAQWIGHKLATLGHPPRIHEWEIGADDHLAEPSP